MMHNIIQPAAPGASPGAFPDRSIRLNFSIQPLAFFFSLLPSFSEAQLIKTAFQREITRNNAKKKQKSK